MKLVLSDREVENTESRELGQEQNIKVEEGSSNDLWGRSADGDVDG